MTLTTASIIRLAKQAVFRPKFKPVPQQTKPSLTTYHSEPSLRVEVEWDEEPSYFCDNPHERTDWT